jgi:hypothetical protein
MTPIGNSSFAPTALSYIGDGNYEVSSDGGQTKSVINEQAANEMLSAVGLKVQAGEVSSAKDNFVVSPTNAAVVSFNSDAPALPDVAGIQAPLPELAAKMEGQDFSEMSIGMLSWMALSEMARTSQTDMAMSKDLRHAMQKMKYDAKSLEIDATSEKIDAERTAAWVNFGISCAAAAVNIVGAVNPGQVFGSQFVAAAVGQGGSQVIQAGGQAVDKSYGAQAEADEQQLRILHLQQLQENMDQAIDESNSNYQESKEQFKQALRLIDGMVERQTQVVQTITR